MQKKALVMALTAVMIFVLSMPVKAQTNTPAATLGSLSSNTSMATAGIFKSDVDNFINYNKYSGVLKDAKLFSFLTGRADAGGVLDAGFAYNFGSLYLGAWYRGNIFRVANTTETHTITPVWDNDTETLHQTTETTSYSAIKWQESANQIEFLIGVAKHGIKIGFLEWLASDGNPGTGTITVTDYLDGRIDYQNATVNYERSQGYLKPYLGWGASIAVGSATLMPYVDLGLQIYNNILVANSQNYTEVYGVKQNVVSTVGAGNNQGLLQPYGVAGIKIDLVKKNTTTLELKYGFDMRLYNNSYDATGLSGNVDGTVSWTGNGYVDRVTDYFDRTETTTDINLTITKPSYMKHSITPIYKIVGDPAENFKLGFSASIPVTLTSESRSSYTDQYQIIKSEYKADSSMNYVETKRTISYSNRDTETSSLNIALNLNMGASYKLIPNRFTINAGIGAIPTAYTHSEIKGLPNSVDSIEMTTTIDAFGNVTEGKAVTPTTGNNGNDSITITESWNQWSANLYGGFTFYFTPKATLDMGVNSSIGSGNGFNLDLATVNVIFTFKF
ncbi:hypothetical protein R84B8_00467 [Treponema sp. R8-4-B8]